MMPGEYHPQSNETVNYLPAREVRRKFLEFFKSKGHHIVPSAPIVLKNDPTLMFTNAGMNQFKDYFLGNKVSPYPRIADTQKCLRVSGKHNDLEEVGVDTYHHTMFEMLGNWSFGDYFKKEAVAWSWQFLTEVLMLPQDRLYVTVFEGDEKENLPEDLETAEEWKKWIDHKRIIKGNKKDNFWEMGETGPCGPCTEINFDFRTDEERRVTEGNMLVNTGHPQVIEIWNNVFIQFNRLNDGSLRQLPSKHVDTGMGFERLLRIIQHKESNYDTDVFSDIINKISTITHKAYTSSNSDPDIAIRVNADHIRAIAFTISDGQMPSNTGAGYVVRRILRRAVRYYFTHLSYQKPMLYQLVPVLANQFAEIFPELKTQESFVSKVIYEEEEAFLRTLDKGLKRIDDILTTSKSHISGKEAFELYDTYGFPLDLTRLIAAEKNISIDEASFTAEMQKQKERSRTAAASGSDDWVMLKEGNSEFIGYNTLEVATSLLRYRKAKLKGKELYQVVIEKTPFYPESGGQAGDTGELILNNSAIKVLDTKKENDLIVHFTETMPSSGSEVVKAIVNEQQRRYTAAHHTATHLLHAALRKVLGSHVEQKGSLVNADYLRFDFSHFRKMTEEEIKEAEHIVNQKIRENIPVVIHFMPKEEALKSGAMALFGEKYGDVVRVVTIDPSYSVELCGGTHSSNTGELGFFKILSESAISSGIRRIEAISGKASEDYLITELEELKLIKSMLNSPRDPSGYISSMIEELATLKKQIAKAEETEIETLASTIATNFELIKGIQFAGTVINLNNTDSLRKLAFAVKGKLSKAIIILASAINDKAAVYLLIDEYVADMLNIDASELIRQKIAPLIKGGGGGQKTMASAGGKDVSALQKVIETVKSHI